MRQRCIGGQAVGAIGLGVLPLAIAQHGHDAAMTVLRSAVDAGITLIDTADSYTYPTGPDGHGELLVARALAGLPDCLLVATKGGRRRDDRGAWRVDGSPDWLRAACTASLRRLAVDAIGLYQLHRPDPTVPFAESVGALRELIDQGKIRMAGLCNVDTAQIRAAIDILGSDLVSVQNRFAQNFRESEPELRLCESLGIAFLPWGPLGGIGRTDGPSRGNPVLAQLAAVRGISVERLSLAWLLATSRHTVPIPGCSRAATVMDSARAAEVDLTADEVRRLDCC
jgi:aryl-alcohol dehydrogenase-like predicted oxidoreductase